MGFLGSLPTSAGQNYLASEKQATRTPSDHSLETYSYFKVAELTKHQGQHMESQKPARCWKESYSNIARSPFTHQGY